MRTVTLSESGAIQLRTLASIVFLVAVAGLVLVLLNRPPSRSTTTETPSVPVEVSRTNLVLEAGALRASAGAAPFNGIMVEHHVDGTLRSRSAVSNGVLQGLSQGWFTNGQMQVSENFKQGVSQGTRTKWYADGTKQSEANIVDGKIHGTFRRWHPNGTPAEQAEFVADKPEGLSTAWFPSGYLKARVVMKDGKSIEQAFWKDGEKRE